MLDAIPLLVLVAVIGAWHLYRSNSDYQARRSLAMVIIISLAIVSALVSFLLAFTGAGSRMDDVNPTLYREIIEFFSWD